MMNRIIFFVLLLCSCELMGQCLTVSDLTVRTAKSCSYFNNGVLIIKHLNAKTPYSIVVNDKTYSYTANEYGTLSIYSLAPGTYERISITDRVNSCPVLTLDNPVLIESWENVIDGPTKVCKGETVKLNSSAVSTWTINSNIINFNATETDLTIEDNNTITVIAKALIEGCYERDTLQIQVDEIPQVSLTEPHKSYCSNKQNELVELSVVNGDITSISYNNEELSVSPTDVYQINLGDQVDDNVFRIIAESPAQCKINTEIALPIAGEAPIDDVEIIWWPGNIFSINNDNTELEYRWGWFKANGDKSYARIESVSSDGKHFFAGNQSVEVVDLVEKGASSDYLLFVEYNTRGEECNNSLLFNSSKMPVFRSQAQYANTGLSLKAYPNPFVDNITISSTKITGFEALQLSIVDASGKLFFLEAIEISNGFLTQLSTTDFPSGTYFIQLSHQGFTLLSHKLIKQ